MRTSTSRQAWRLPRDGSKSGNKHAPKQAQDIQAKTQKPQDLRELVGVGAGYDAVELETMPPIGLEPMTR